LVEAETQSARNRNLNSEIIMKKTKISRRTLLKGAAGLAAGSTLVTGFPAVHAADEKVLRYLGTAVNQSDDIKTSSPPLTTSLSALLLSRIHSTFLIPNISA